MQARPPSQWTRTPSRPRCTRPTVTRSCPGSTIQDTSRLSVQLVEEHDVKLDRSAHRPRPDHRLPVPARSSGPSCFSPTRSSSSGSSDKYLAHLLFEERGIASPPTWLPNGRARRRAVPAPREGPARLRLTAHLPCCRPRPARLLRSATRRSTRSSRLSRRRGVLDRRVLRPRRSLPQCDPSHDDRVEGRRVDQGDDASATNG